MPISLLMPALSPTMTEGNLARWNKKEGDLIEPGDIIAEIETDKATMEFEAVDEGRLGKILIPEGTERVPVNEAIAILFTEGEDEGSLASLSEHPPSSTPSLQTEQDSLAPQPTQPVSTKSVSGERIFASPLARRLARQNDLDLSVLSGSGSHGRIIKRDIEQTLVQRTSKQPQDTPSSALTEPSVSAIPQQLPARKPSQPQTSEANARDIADKMGISYDLIPHTMMRKTIARRLTEAKQTIPHFYLTIDCEIDTLLKVRKNLNARSDSYKLSVNDFIIRAVALSLHKVSEANVSWHEDGVLQYHHADIAVAVAIPDGLITPIVTKAETKGLETISNQMQDFIQRARVGRLKPEEYTGGTFTISNLGMYGIREFSAVINPPQGCILAIGQGEGRAVVRQGEIISVTMMTCTLSVDHRVVDGAIAARFLETFKQCIQDPLTMLL